jgi:AcrR family transcriptional regulator
LKDLTAEQRILAAAKKVFMEKGLSGARMQDIANEAGINKALVHYYFRCKEKLFAVIFKEAASKLFPRIVAIVNEEIPLFDKIRNFTRQYLEVVIENPYLPMFVLNEMHKQPHAFHAKMFGNNPPDFSKLARQIDEEYQQGIIKAVNPAHLIMNMMSMCVFPFIGKPMIQEVMKIDDLQFRYLMEQRKTEIANFIIDSIKK